MTLSFFYRLHGSILMMCFCILLSCTNTFGQLENIENSYSKDQSNLQEKIFVHTDRTFYLCGEIIWFKAYLANALNNEPLSLSKVAYIEILDKTNLPVLQAKIAIKDGVGSGSFLLPFSISSGNYKLRAYTNWMKNFSSEHYFNKNISIINTTRNLDSAIVHESVTCSASFFPEGGALVNGLESEIAFKTKDNKNTGINSEGVIVDGANDTIVHFKTLHAGIGHFYLSPEKGKDYMAVINCSNGVVIRQKLPGANDAGYVLHVTDTNSSSIKISVKIAGEDEKMSRDVFVLIQNNQQINFAKSLRMQNNYASWEINKDSLKEGVTQITVFDGDRQPVCERLFFKRPEKKLLINVQPDQSTYQLRNKVIFNVSTKDQGNRQLSGNLSVAVFRLDGFHKPDPANIFSYLWLSSNLQGSIEDAGYYFSNENKETSEALDNLLLAQGWRKFDRNKNLPGKKPAFTYMPEYLGHIITGRITNNVTGQPAAKVLVYLSVPGRRVQLKGCESDSAGFIHFDMKDFIGSNQIILQTHLKDDSLFRIKIFSPFSEEFADRTAPALHVAESESEYLQNRNFHMQIENGYREKELQEWQTPLIDSLPFYIHPFKTYLLDNYTRFTTMEEVLREYVAEVAVRRKGSQFRLMVLNEPGYELQKRQPAEIFFENNPLILLDGVPVSKVNKIMAYDPLKVQKIEVVASRYFFGPVIADGIVSCTTYKGNLDGYTLDPGDLVLDYDALQQQRIFDSPDYSADSTLHSRLPDFRELLYWSPEINTNEKGEGNFSFYTGDIPGKYLAVFQGISADGHAGSISIPIDVKK
jgi:hypothetical protein